MKAPPILAKTATAAYLESINPLRGLSIASAYSIFDAARNGDTQRLHWIYQEIETQNPVLSMAVTRRSGAAANFAWRISERAAQDGALSAEQKDAAERFFADIDNFADMFEHLDLALFRGFAHAQPVWASDTSVAHINLLDSWLFLKKDGQWYFNPACDGFSRSAQDTRFARLVTIERRRPVDVPALGLHIRQAVGERDWGRLLERYAIPKPAVIMHDGATVEDRGEYLKGVRALENGQPTVWPAGAGLTDFAGGSRGMDPFTPFVEHQEKTILMLATGGTLGSMAEAGAGTLAGNAQADVWQAIVARDAGIIASAITRAMLRPFLAAAFPGRPSAVDFSFDFTQKPTPKEIFETAAAARSAGYLIRQDELEEMTGYALEKDAQSPSPGPGFGLNSKAPAKTPLQNGENRLQNAPRVLDGQSDLPAEESLAGALERVFQNALAEAAADGLSGKDGELANSECRSPHPELCRVHGNPVKKSDGADNAPSGTAEKDSPKKTAADKAGAPGDSGSSGAPAEAANTIKVLPQTRSERQGNR